MDIIDDEYLDAAFSEFAEELMPSQARPKKRTAYFSKKEDIQGFVNSIQIGELIFYAEVFGTKKLFRMQNGDIKYIVFDSYCVVPDCDCTETQLSFTKETEKYETNEDFSFILDYKNGEVKDGINISYLQLKEISNEFTDEMKKILEERHQELKEKLKPFMLKKMERFSKKDLFKKQKRKIGRNEPCPCGSGKKYKKCCLDKDREL
jgi:uncharacterized protein YecA (UPF0149 family)